MQHTVENPKTKNLSRDLLKSRQLEALQSRLANSIHELFRSDPVLSNGPVWQNESLTASIEYGPCPTNGFKRDFQSISGKSEPSED